MMLRGVTQICFLTKLALGGAGRAVPLWRVDFGFVLALLPTMLAGWKL